MSSVSRFRLKLICGAALCALATGAMAAPIQILRPNTTTVAGSVSATLNGTTVVNQGL